MVWRQPGGCCGVAQSKHQSHTEFLAEFEMGVHNRSPHNLTDCAVIAAICWILTLRGLFYVKYLFIKYVIYCIYISNVVFNNYAFWISVLL